VDAVRVAAYDHLPYTLLALRDSQRRE